jgi:hypothetical protein
MKLMQSTSATCMSGCRSAGLDKHRTELSMDVTPETHAVSEKLCEKFRDEMLHSKERSLRVQILQSTSEKIRERRTGVSTDRQYATLSHSSEQRKINL